MLLMRRMIIERKISKFSGGTGYIPLHKDEMERLKVKPGDWIKIEIIEEDK